MVRSVLKPVSLADCRYLIAESSSLPASKLFSGNSPDFPDAVRREILLSRCSPEEIVKLSSLFLEERTRALGKIRPILPESLQASLLFVPSSKVAAFAVPAKTGYVMLTTAGLYELLRAHCVNSVWSTHVERLEKKIGAPLISARAVEEYLNLRSVLFLAGKGTILSIEDGVSEEIRDAGWRLAEVALLFIVLHEYGHAHYATMNKDERNYFISSIRLRVTEKLTTTKIEEFFADRFALDCVEPELAGPLAHAAVAFFSLRTAIEAAGFVREDSHPLAINRLWALSERARTKTSEQDYQMDPVETQLTNMERLWSSTASLREKRSDSWLSRLTKLAEHREKEIDLPVVISGISALEKSLKS